MLSIRFAMLGPVALALSLSASARAEYSQETIRTTMLVPPLQDRAIELLERCRPFVDDNITDFAQKCKREVREIAAEMHRIREYLSRACIDEDASNLQTLRACFGVRDEAGSAELTLIQFANRMVAD